MVHHRMLPRPRRRSDDRAGSHGAGGPTARHRPISGGGLQYGFGGDVKRREIAETLMEAVVKDVTAHFLPRKRLWGRER